MHSNTKSLLERHEGLRLKPYFCTSNKLTIGYGRNLDDRGISEAEASAMLTNDLIDAERQCLDKFKFFGKLGDVRKAVLIDMTVNLGIDGLSKFKKTLSLIASGQYKEASIEMLDSLWARQVKSRAIRLSEMMDTGRWPEDL